jgi:hypothetical protein
MPEYGVHEIEWIRAFDCQSVYSMLLDVVRFAMEMEMRAPAVKINADDGREGRFIF